MFRQVLVVAGGAGPVRGAWRGGGPGWAGGVGRSKAWGGFVGGGGGEARAPPTRRRAPRDDQPGPGPARDGPRRVPAGFARPAAAALMAGPALPGPLPGDITGHATRIALGKLGQRAQFLDAQQERLPEPIIPSSQTLPSAC